MKIKFMPWWLVLLALILNACAPNPQSDVPQPDYVESGENTWSVLVEPKNMSIGSIEQASGGIKVTEPGKYIVFGEDHGVILDGDKIGVNVKCDEPTSDVQRVCYFDGYKITITLMSDQVLAGAVGSAAPPSTVAPDAAQAIAPATPSATPSGVIMPTPTLASGSMPFLLNRNSYFAFGESAPAWDGGVTVGNFVGADKGDTLELVFTASDDRYTQYNGTYTCTYNTGCAAFTTLPVPFKATMPDNTVKWYFQ